MMWIPEGEKSKRMLIVTHFDTRDEQYNTIQTEFTVRRLQYRPRAHHIIVQSRSSNSRKQKYFQIALESGCGL